MDLLGIASNYVSVLWVIVSLTVNYLHRTDEKRLEEGLPARRSSLFWLAPVMLSALVHLTLCAVLLAFDALWGAGWTIAIATLLQIHEFMSALDSYGKHSLAAGRLERKMAKKATE